MAGFCGWVGFDSTVENAEKYLQAMSARLRANSDYECIYEVSEQAGFAATGSATIACSNSVCVVFDGVPLWQDPELAQICTDLGPAEALIVAYERYGNGCVKQLRAAWAFALYDRANNYVLVAIDRMGRKPMCYANIKGTDGSNGLVFASSVDAIREHPAIAAKIDEQSIYDLLYFTRISAPGTIYYGVKKLGPGEAVERKDDRARTFYYWRMRYDRKSNASAENLASDLRKIVREAVERSLEGTTGKDVGAFLSGGVDSTTITGLLSELIPNKAKAFTVGFEAPGFDEMNFAAAAARHFNVEHHKVYVTPSDIIAFLPLMVEIFDEPYANGSAVPAYYCSRLAAREGVGVLLAGDGGDELFAGNERYTHMRIFEKYLKIPLLLRTKIIEPVLLALPSNTSLAVLNKAKSYVRRSNIRLPERMESYNDFGFVKVDSFFAPSIADKIEPRGPIETMQRHYNAPENASVTDRMMHLDLQMTIADDDLRKVSRTAEANGIEVRYPLLDDELVEFSSKIPERLHLKGGKLRAFFKFAMKDLLPESTLSKTKHGFGLPFNIWIHTDPELNEYTHDKLANLATRGIFRDGFVESTIKFHHQKDLPCHGQLVWVMLLFELWLESRFDCPETGFTYLYPNA